MKLFFKFIYLVSIIAISVYAYIYYLDHKETEYDEINMNNINEIFHIGDNEADVLSRLNADRYHISMDNLCDNCLKHITAENIIYKNFNKNRIIINIDFDKNKLTKITYTVDKLK